MYGGMGLGMGGMGGMYGSGMGMGSSMYGSGMGMGSGMYGSGMGMGSSMYGSGMGMNNGMYGGGNTFGMGMNNSTMNNGMQGFGNTNGLNNDFGTNSANGLNGSPVAGGIGSPIGGDPQQNQGTGVGIPGVCGAPPPLHETPAERAKRIREERRRERELLLQQKQKREQMRLQARMEMAGHFTNVLVQSLRSVVEFCTVCFGTYYSMKTFRQMASMPQMSYQRGPNGMMVPVQQSIQSTAGEIALGAAKSGRSWKMWAIFGILFVIVEVLYNVLTRKRDTPKPKPEIQELLDSAEDELEDLEDELLTSGLERGNSESVDVPTRGVYVALHDYEVSNGDGYLTFKTGDRFLVENYKEGTWCAARPFDSDGQSPRQAPFGYVPSNYLRQLEQLTKL